MVALAGQNEVEHRRLDALDARHALVTAGAWLTRAILPELAWGGWLRG